MTDRQLKIGQIVGGPEGLRVGISVQWNKYPQHLTRQVRVTVGAFAVYDAPLDEVSRDRSCQVLSQVLADHEELCRELTGALMEVVL